MRADVKDQVDFCNAPDEFDADGPLTLASAQGGTWAPHHSPPETIESGGEATIAGNFGPAVEKATVVYQAGTAGSFTMTWEIPRVGADDRFEASTTIPASEITIPKSCVRCNGSLKTSADRKTKRMGYAPAMGATIEVKPLEMPRL